VLLRRPQFFIIARAAGCHVWIDPGRILFANRSLLAVHINDSHAPMRIHLPQPMDVTDLVAGREVARGARHFLIQNDIRRCTTFLYRLRRAAGPSGRIAVAAKRGEANDT